MAEYDQKPVDRWLGIFGVVVGILFYLLPKIPAVVVGSLVLIFVLLIHPIWNFWWIEESLARRSIALGGVLILLVIVGVSVWPEPPKPGEISQLPKSESPKPKAETKAATPKVEPKQPLPSRPLLQEDIATINIVIVRDREYNIAPLNFPLIMNNFNEGNGYTFLEDVVEEWKFHNPANSLPIAQSPIDPVPLDITEVAFWHWMTRRYGLHWDMKRVEFHGISGGGSSETSNVGAESNPMVLTSTEIDHQLKDNTFFKAPIHVVMGNIKFPSASKVVFNRGEITRTIRVQMPEVGELTITLANVGGGRLGATALAEKLKAKYPTYLWEEHMTVSFEYQYLPYSPTLEARQERIKRWVEEMVSLFKRDFDWSVISEELKKSL